MKVAFPIPQRECGILPVKNDTGKIVGDFCFKGIGDDGVVEIGYIMDGSMFAFDIYLVKCCNSDEKVHKNNWYSRTHRHMQSQ